jgi:V/A-type H+-transporting ATPase subunit K
MVGAALAVFLACAGSAIGVSRTGQAGAGLLSKNPNKFVDVMILQALPATQGLYGFVVAFLAVFVKIKFGANMNHLTYEEGLSMLILCLPVGIAGFASAVLQGSVAVSGINMIGKQEKQLVKAIVLTAMVELFAIFAFIVSILGVLQLGVTA